MTHKFSVEDIKMLAEVDRDMDSGKQPHVVDGSRNRWTVMPEAMEELGLKNGQTVSAIVITAILEAHVASLQARIAVDLVAKRVAP